MTRGIKYIAYGGASGYGLAALAYVRALHNAGVPLWWQTWHLGPQPAPLRIDDWRGGDDANLTDLAALVRAVGHPREYDTLVVHTVPEHWPRFVEPGKRFVGYTVWEADALPAHWPELLDVADLILVPSEFNRQIFLRSGVRKPVRVVPHVRRHAWSASAADDAVGLRLRMRIPDGHFVLYSIGVWDPRKALGELVDAFAREFAATEPVTLLLKTSSCVSNAALEAQSGMDVQQLTARIVAEASRATGRAAGNVACIAADDINGRTLDAIHATGGAYVSVSHGEGWGMGAFDAATLGKPVLITGWGGQIDYLGAGYPGLLRYEMAQVSGWLPHASYRATQRWAQADPGHVAQRMRAAVARDDSLRGAATAVREEITNRFAEPIVAKRFTAALDG